MILFQRKMDEKYLILRAPVLAPRRSLLNTATIELNDEIMGQIDEEKEGPPIADLEEVIQVVHAQVHELEMVVIAGEAGVILKTVVLDPI